MNCTTAFFAAAVKTYDYFNVLHSTISIFFVSELLGLNLSAHKKEAQLQPPRPSQVTQNRPQIVIPPRSTAMIPPGHVKNTLLHLFDVGSPSRMTLKEKRDTFRTLQKYLTSEIGKC